MSHFSQNKILAPVQHGFRSKHSYERQLLTITDKCIQNFEGKTQTDVAVPHQRLLHKKEFGEQL